MFSFVLGIWNWKPIPDPHLGLGFTTDLNVLQWEFALGDPYQILSSMCYTELFIYKHTGFQKRIYKTHLLQTWIINRGQYLPYCRIT